MAADDGVWDAGRITCSHFGGWRWGITYLSILQKNRVYVWRKLKEWGAEYFKQGVALLPLTAQSIKQFRTLASKIREMGGEAVLVEMKYLDQRDEQELIRRFQKQSEREYLELVRDCANLVENLRSNLLGEEGREQVHKMQKRYEKLRGRDYFRQRPRGDISGSLMELAEDMADTGGQLEKKLRELLL